METLYRKVNTDERNPDEQKIYLTGSGWITYHPLLKEWRQSNMDALDGYLIFDPGWWLEEIEEQPEVSVEKILKILRNYRFADTQHGKLYVNDLDLDKAAQAIHKLIYKP